MGVAESGHELCLSTFCRDVAMLRLYVCTQCYVSTSVRNATSLRLYAMLRLYVSTSVRNATSGHTRKL
ncbi:hypothetical protein [Fischerella thermalis]|uniref:hypothetical protein n=1 Tax=Fischerella thermalis TaxID=372787 RepID=UPI0012F8FD46|nr:hypothetical protein [Fischerella thermalis]